MTTKMDVLVVENDGSVGPHIKKAIIDLGHKVELLQDNMEALERTRQKHFDLLFINVFVNHEGGQRLIPRIRALHPKIHIVAMTDYNSRDLEAEVRKEGIAFYMIKPFDPDEIKEILLHIAKKRRKEAEKK